MNKKLKSFCIKQLPKWLDTEENEIVDVIGVDNGALMMIKVLYKQEFAHHPSEENIAMEIWQKFTRVLGNEFETWNKQQIEDLLKKVAADYPRLERITIGKIEDVLPEKIRKNVYHFNIVFGSGCWLYLP